jgi:quercetin dioxygenase-like cupin family protein
MHNKKLTIGDQFRGVKEYFSPRIVGEVNDVFVKIAKLKGQDIPWHSHTHEDEMFYVIRGRMTMEVKGMGATTLNEQDMFIVGKGTEHRVFADEECWIMLVENKETKHTGNVESTITKTVDQQRY